MFMLLLISERTILVSGVDLQFHWDEVEAYERQPDGSLFSWFERYCCYRHIIYGIVNTSNSTVILKSDGNKVHWEPGEPLLRKLESVGIVKEVFPVHDEKKREAASKKLGIELVIAVVCPFCFIHKHNSWAVLFFQFWKRKNSALLVRWQMNYPAGADNGSRFSEGEWYHFHSPVELMKKQGADKPDKPREKEAFQREEWLGHFMRFRNDAMIILSIICLRLPFELAFAHVYEYFNKIGGKISVKLVKYENNKNRERRADSWVYKVFGLYFMQSYIGIFYHALLHRNIMTLRHVLIQRLIISEVLENMLENFLPYLKYSFKKYRAVGNKRKREKGTSSEKTQYMSRVEKEYLKPDYSANFLELALQFGMIMMLACAFPLGFAFATLNNITEIRIDALKLLAMLRRPIPRPDASIGAWLNIFQFLIVMSICTNCILLVCLYDHEGKWKISPGLAAILIMEHVLLLIKFVFSRIVLEEPAWIRANRMKNATYVHDMCSRQLLRSISGEKMHAELKKDYGDTSKDLRVADVYIHTTVSPSSL
ncbi:hypothetical protein K7X08_023968 [Anisodus acutangulus]|uniref:Anoctamin transmembrane domain-containing protein n=1 Tax=Anisodus acutangulus TaxID=402998 RepID=A0A9Q1M6V7_9SOLA|nr:hypothetical protein K7X08_023968 [Anisodus acutangulus]